MTDKAGSPVGFLPYGRQTIEDDDIAAVVAALRSDYLTTGPAVDGFEAALCAETGALHAVACANGTAALHMAALALDLGPGDWIVVPTVTFLATANAARYVGAEVVFADVDPDSGLMRAADLEAALGRIPAGGTAKAVFNVHLGGHVGDVEGIHALARRHGLTVVDDASHALGTRYRDPANGWNRVGEGAHADMTTFSFHPVKTVTMGEGGAVTTNDAGLAKRLRLARSHGMTRDPLDFQQADLALAADGSPNPWYYEMAAPGFNYRATDIQCALGSSQLVKLRRFVDRRQALTDAYDRKLANLLPMVRPVSRRETQEAGLHLYPVLIDFAALGFDRAALMHRLRARGIGTQVHYIPVHLQPYYRQRYGAPDLPGALGYYQRCLSLPLYAGMEEADVERVTTALAESLSAG
ncbi:MAG: UDP-4-amino-4,6-dideoxy-N-acetyl-beta-L-altrosamine transaminase [Alphaproteobacteria bacterium]|nr:UDP-4-amino-4,6-dideoxy-N-acetyl-beta-L-altrosamine transaminase [Alphaproteobacteria bacterium]MBU0797899.1 UDP-4-amino-4,6-dideoxy-N-acetyl-beta-L-altrosamine transaminase [Alphaproteobacteria bacterium]MBU0886149.1 UDP-4-amino-4,6-dideoxy-N-acetyl-beta-L-altrosamine transaminase [Alphaproteobacteria bacterium]MBU1812789.1 UDP-4-amino-4,6-dideoxy-N-acetyl-beta-L-altrosamine transaminase [Alphaproteobacteria bacterium]